MTADPYPVSYTLAIQFRDPLIAAIKDWRASTGKERARDRRYALPLVQRARRERDEGRTSLRRAVEAAALRRPMAAE